MRLRVIFLYFPLLTINKKGYQGEASLSLSSFVIRVLKDQLAFNNHTENFSVRDLIVEASLILYFF